MAPLDKDVHLTVEFLAFLRAGFYGQIIFQQSLERLGSSYLAPNYLDIAHKAFDKMDSWLKDATQNLPILSTSWAAPETFDAISAFGFMRDLKKELQTVVQPVEQALALPDLAQQRDAVKLLASAVNRSAASRAAFAETLYQLYSQLQAQELAQGVSGELPGAREYFQVGRAIVDTFTTDAAYDIETCERLRIEASLTPGDFRAHIHDANILLNVFAKDFTFELAEFSRSAAQEWIERQIPAVAAGYWAAYKFAPEDYLAWKEVGVTAAPLAANWRRSKFEPKEAIQWIREGIAPGLAREWHDAGFNPPRAASLLRRGLMSPSQAPKDGAGDNQDEQGGSQDQEDSF
jgi:hypothetical protein